MKPNKNAPPNTFIYIKWNKTYVFHITLRNYLFPYKTDQQFNNYIFQLSFVSDL